MVAVFLIIIGFVLGCASIIMSTAFAIAARDKLYDESYGLLAAAVCTMAVALGLSIAAGRLM